MPDDAGYVGVSDNLRENPTSHGLRFTIIFRVWRWPGNRAVIVADRGTVRPPPHGWTVARLHGWPCGWPCTVGRPGCTVGRAAGRARFDPVGRPTVFLAVHGWPADRVPGRTRTA